MTRPDLISELAERCKHLSLNDSELGVKIILDAMKDSLAQGRRIEIRGFGVFSTVRKAPRMGRNRESRGIWLSK